MAVKYKIEYTNHSGDEFLIEISKDGYNGSVNTVRGSARLDRPQVKDMLSPLRGSGLLLDLEANQDLKFRDLYTEKETDYRVDFYRNGQNIFRGFINPEGLYQSLVNERWVISLDCVDGLGILSDLSFVQENGTHFSGYMTEIDIVYHALKRSTIDVPINVDVRIWHDGMNIDQDVLANTQDSADRFYKDKENDDLMSCEEVLTSILEKYNAVIQQENGEWYIYRPMDLARTGTMECFRYVSGEFDSMNEFPANLKIGSHVNEFDHFHVNENQRIEMRGGISKFRVKYEFGVGESALLNPDFKPDSNGNIPNWRKAILQSFRFPDDGLGIMWDEFQGMDLIHSGTYDLMNDRQITVNKDDEFSLTIDFESYGIVHDLPIQIRIKPDAQGQNIQYLGNKNRTLEWGDANDNNTYYYFRNKEITSYTDEHGGQQGEPITWEAYKGEGRNTRTINFQVPVTGKMEIYILPPTTGYTPSIPNMPNYPAEAYGRLHRFALRPKGDQELSEDGMFYTAWLSPRNQAKTKDNKTVYNGDNDSDIYTGAIKRMDGLNTYAWGRKHRGSLFRRNKQNYPDENVPAESKHIISIMVEDTIRLLQKPQKYYAGDVFGYFSSLNIFQIDGEDGLFFPVGYSYDSIKNIVSLELNQVFTDELKRQIQRDIKPDYGRTVKPAIDS